MGCFVKVLSGWVDRTGLGDTVLVGSLDELKRSSEGLAYWDSGGDMVQFSENPRD